MTRKEGSGGRVTKHQARLDLLNSDKSAKEVAELLKVGVSAVRRARARHDKKRQPKRKIATSIFNYAETL